MGPYGHSYPHLRRRGTRWAVGRIQGLCSASGSLMASAPLRLSEKHALQSSLSLRSLVSSWEKSQTSYSPRQYVFSAELRSTDEGFGDVWACTELLKSLRKL